MSKTDFTPTHLGKTATGELMTPYVTPDVHDPSLLQPIERDMNRIPYNIDNSIFDGIDIWNCYETTFLNERGYPISGITRIIFYASTHYIVESKSLKLYLNSFNMERLPGRWKESIDTFRNTVQHDLIQKIAPCSVDFLPISGFDNPYGYSRIFHGYEELDSSWLYNIDIPENNKFTESPEVLRLNTPHSTQTKTFKFSGLRSNCRVTNQPDYADVFVHYDKHGKSVSPDSLLQYLVSFRKENHFHEEVVEMIYKRLYDLDGSDGLDLAVAAFYTRRGGIDISPIRYSPTGYFKQRLNNLRNVDPHYFLFKTVRQ